MTDEIYRYSIIENENKQSPVIIDREGKLIDFGNELQFYGSSKNRKPRLLTDLKPNEKLSENLGVGGFIETLEFQRGETNEQNLISLYNSFQNQKIEALTNSIRNNNSFSFFLKKDDFEEQRNKMQEAFANYFIFRDSEDKIKVLEITPEPIRRNELISQLDIPETLEHRLIKINGDDFNAKRIISMNGIYSENRDSLSLQTLNNSSLKYRKSLYGS